MKWPRYISFKSIPSFIIFLPISSLILVTFIIIYITHDIKDEVIENEKQTIKNKHFQHQKSLLKSQAYQLMQEIQNTIDYEIKDQSDLLKSNLDGFFAFYNPASLSKEKLNQAVKAFNTHNKYQTLKVMSPEKLQKFCSQYQNILCSSVLKSDFGYINSAETINIKKIPHIHYLHKISSSLYLLVSFDKDAMYHKIQNRIVDIVSTLKVQDQEHFHILDEEGKELTRNAFRKAHTIETNYIVERLNKAQKEETFFKYQHLYENAKALNELFFVKRCHFFNWIVAVEKPFNTLDEASLAMQKNRIDYLNSRINELTIIIILVALIIIVVSFLIARIITRMFQRYRKHIISQNKTLKSFNKQLSTKIKEKTYELKKSEARYRTIFERSRDAIFIIEDEIITYCNEAALKMFTRNLKSTLINTSLFDLFPEFQPDGNNSKKLLQDYLSITSSLGHSRFEWLVRKADGTTFFVDVWLQDIELEGKNAVHVVFRNIDAQKKAQEKIKEQHKELIALNENLEERVVLEVGKNKKKEQLLLQQSRLAQMGEMISMIAHQWRQPLSAISTASAHLKLLIDLGDHTDELLTEGLSHVDLYVKHLSQTIDDFRDFFKPDKQKEETSLNELVEKSLSIIGTSLENNNINIIFKEKNDHKITIYAHEIMQVILNILKNSEDVLTERKIENAFIEIATYEDNEHYYIKFRDNAQGINAEILDKIFDPYFSTKNEKNGTGLGLYMSKVIVKDHCNGNLEVENSDGGATFIITLPKED